MPATEASIIALAKREGLLREEELEALKKTLCDDITRTSFEWRYGAYLDTLIARGTITEAEVRALAERASSNVDEAVVPVARAEGTAKVRSRYRLIELIAEGGMGRVFKAFDSVLERNVALKLVKNQANLPHAQQLAEAQRQARIEHENVCPIYDVGEIDGQPYIAMQYIGGETLKAAASHIPFEERIRIMAIAARAIHAAHRTGVIHLDVKPSNIMLDQTPEGRLKPYVLDFGVGRDLSRQEQARGRGTPSYMAPEQESPGGEVDRRTDIYGIGATLFEVLSGVRLVDAPNQKVLPPELAAIVAKCVEKDKEDRYQSAFAVAAELERYLAGEPVEAMRADLWYRAKRSARRHKYVLAAAVLATLILVLVGAVRLRDQAQLRTEAALSQRFGQAAERIENTLRIARMMPLHDIRGDLQLARERTNELRLEIALVRGPGFGPGRYALGRAYLAQGELEEARASLLEAWNAGFRDREVAAALGGVHARLYALRLADARNSKSNRAVADARRDFRDPALAYLNRARDLSPEPEHYAEALIAFCEERFDAAIIEAEMAFVKDRSFYEAKLLVARIHADSASQYVAGGQLELAEIAREAAEQAIVEAMSIARSDPEVYALGCRISSDSLYAFNYFGGGDMDETHSMGIARCGRAAKADPGNIEAWVEASRGHKLLAMALVKQNKDPRPALELAAQAASKALEHTPTHPQAMNSLGNAYRSRGEWEAANGIDPTPTLDEAERLLDEAAVRAPSVSHIPNNLGNVHIARARYLAAKKRDPSQAINEAISALERAEVLDPKHYAPPSNLGRALILRAELEMKRGLDATATLDRAARTLDRSLSLNDEDEDTRARREEVTVLQRRKPYASSQR
jgi:serine/threonine-protein kinase